MKKLLLLSAITILSLTGCSKDSEEITIDNKEDWIFDDINIKLDEGYLVKDYQIDYKNNKVILNLYQDE